MSDGRKKQPDEQLLDLTSYRSGNEQFVALIETWTYSSIKNEDVFTRKLTVAFKAMDFAEATGFAMSLAKTIKLAHDVWECNVRCVMQQGKFPLQIDERPKVSSPVARAVLSDDVARLIIAARGVAFGSVADLVHAHGDAEDGEAIKELDQASEAFAGRIDWDDQPDDEGNEQ